MTIAQQECFFPVTLEAPGLVIEWTEMLKHQNICKNLIQHVNAIKQIMWVKEK